MKRRRGDARDQRAVERHRGEHHEEGRGEEPLQVPHAARDAHLVAQRPQDVVGREQAEEVRERPEQRAHFLGSHRDDPGKPAHLSESALLQLFGGHASLPETDEPRSNAFDAASEPAFTGSKPASETSCMPIFSASASSAATGSAMRGAGRFASRAIVA